MRPDASDAEIVAGLQSAEPWAFDTAYARHRTSIYGYLVRLTRSHALAEDLAQETWLRLARAATSLAEGTRLRAWLFTVAHNLFVSHRRFVLVDADRLRELGLRPQNAPETPLDRATRTEAQHTLEAALAALPLAAREVLLLVGVHELSPHEAAGVLGITDDACRQRLSRARGMLNEELERRAR